MTIANFKQMMIEKARKRGGVWENFGDKELRQLREKYSYNPYGTPKERSIANQIDALDEWAMNYCG